MASNSNTASGIDINSLNICYSRCLLEDKAISNICIQPLEVDADDYWESVSVGLDELFKEFKIPGEDVISSLPGEYAIIKKIMLDNGYQSIQAYYQMLSEIEKSKALMNSSRRKIFVILEGCGYVEGNGTARKR